MLLAVANAQNPSSQVEEQICKDNENGREFEKASKAQRNDCKVKCEYTDGSNDIYDSPNGQMCAAVVSIVPSGSCIDGRCSCKYKTIESLIKYELFK